MATVRRPVFFKELYDSTNPCCCLCRLSYGTHQIAPSESFLGLKMDCASSAWPWTRLVGERQSTPKLICHPFALLQSTSFCRCLGNCSGKDSGIVKIVARCKGNITRLPSSLKSHQNKRPERLFIFLDALASADINCL